MAMYMRRKSVDVTRLKSRIEAFRDTTCVDVRCAKGIHAVYTLARYRQSITYSLMTIPLPRLKKLRPDMLKLDMDASSIDDPQELMSDNPEWNDMLRDSGVGRQTQGNPMKMQEEGCRRMMPTVCP